MVSDFKRKKLMFLFKIFFDSDGNGSITKKDFELSIERLAKAKGWEPGDEKYKIAEKTMLEIWEGMLYKADVNKDGEISADEWVALWEESSKDSPFDWQAYYAKSIFHLQDSSNDGAIDKEEFVSVHGSFGLPKDQTSEAFDKLACGKDKVSWEDFQQRWEEFFTSENADAPGNYIFGNLTFE
ncbi:calexcitin-2-like [Bicyclus anynana]|uniref:Calexcitin-2-like n=1 Tax=Bicyclus anynana TaxID=110368 RepID=A0A6J1NU71_BICAN|nr:calexcitin-2-like [Bicyclus anynana]